MLKIYLFCHLGKSRKISIGPFLRAMIFKMTLHHLWFLLYFCLPVHKIFLIPIRVGIDPPVQYSKLSLVGHFQDKESWISETKFLSNNQILTTQLITLFRQIHIRNMKVFR